jgi:hypothetical protein
VKTCSICGVEKDLSEFYSRHKFCKPCATTRSRERQRNNPDQWKIQKNYDLKRKYGIDLDQFNTILASQDCCCVVCGSIKSLVVDHNHSTGDVRGILCSSCNVSAGRMGDSPSRLRALADYLEDVGHYGST